MLGFDLPVEELAVYQGINPRPADFDAYWSEALAELAALPLDVEVRPVETPASFATVSDLYVTGVGGARVYAKVLEPRGIPRSGAAVLMFHGYTGNSGDWTDKLPYVAQGQVVIAMDCRGQGGFSEDVGGVPGPTQRGHIIRGLRGEPKQLLYRQIFLDCALMYRVATEHFDIDPDRVGSFGASQGGALSLACAALVPRIARTVSLYPFLSDYQRVWQLGLARDAYHELGEYFKRFDPRHEHEAETFLRLGYIDIQHLAPRIRSSVTMLTGLSDEICPPSSQYAAYNKITSTKRVIHYPDFGHETLPGAADIAFEIFAAL